MKTSNLIKIIVCIILLIIINISIKAYSEVNTDAVLPANDSEAVEITNSEEPLNDLVTPEENTSQEPVISFEANNYVIGEKIIIHVQVPETGVKFNLKKALKISRPIVEKDIENYQDDLITLKMVDKNNYIGYVRTDIGAFFPGEYEFTFTYTDDKNNEYSIEKTIQVGKISITNENLDFSLLNDRYQSMASLFIESTLSQDKKLYLSIIPKDRYYTTKDFKYDKEITINGKKEVFIKFSLPKNVFKKERLTFVNDDIKSKVQIILKNSNNQVLYKVAIPMQFVIGSYLEYNLEFIVISITVFIALLIFSYQVWKRTQPAILSGTLYCKKPKNTKTYLIQNTWNLSDFKAKEGTIGTSQKALIDIPLLNPEEALLIAKGQVQNTTLWIKPCENGIVEINNKPITEEMQINDGDDININGYLFSWKK